MKCKECGKFTLSDGEQVPYHNLNNAIAGRKTAIASAVMPCLTIIMFVFALIASKTGVDNVGKTEIPAGIDIASLYFYSGIFFMLAGVVCSVLSPIYAVRSIRTYKRIVSWGSVETPKLTYVLGIIGAVISVIAVIVGVFTVGYVGIRLVEFVQILIFGA